MQQFDQAAWLQGGLDKTGRKKRDVADLLGRDPSFMTRVLKGERKLRPDEIELVTEFLSLPIPAGAPKLRRLGDKKVQGVRVVGIISHAHWVDPDVSVSPRIVSGKIHEDWPLDEQEAYEVEVAPKMPCRYQAGDIILTVPFKRYRGHPLPGDKIVRELHQGNLRSYHLVLCTRDGLFDMMTGDPLEGEGDFVGLVIGFHGD